MLTQYARPISHERSVQEDLEELLTTIAKERGLSDVALLASDLHVYPDHHGNRSPYADPTLRGMVREMQLYERLTQLLV